MIAILVENISEFFNQQIDFGKINFSDYILHSLFLKIKERSEEICLVSKEELINKPNLDLVVCSNKADLGNLKNFLYVFYEEDNKNFTFTLNNTSTQTILPNINSNEKSKPKKYALSSPLFIEEMFNLSNEKCFCFMHFDDTSMEYIHLIEQYRGFPVVYRYDGNKYQIPENHGQRFFNFNFLIRNDILSKTKYYIDFRSNIEINIHAAEALDHGCVVYLPNTEKNKLSFNHPNVRFMNRRVNPQVVFCDEPQVFTKISSEKLVQDILNKHIIVKKSKIYI